MAKVLEDMGSDIICLKDMAGLLTLKQPRASSKELRKQSNCQSIYIRMPPQDWLA